LWFKNFQNHKFTEIILAPDGGITSITGPSDGGKSSAFRALQYLFLVGKCDARSGESDVEVGAEFTDLVIRRKTRVGKDDRNISDCIEIDGIEEPWTKMNRQLPSGVRKFTRIANLDVEGLDKKLSLNFLTQEDRWLPLDFRPSEISKILGSISGRNDVDSAIRDTNAQIKRLAREINLINEELTTRKQEVADAEERLPELDPSVKAIVTEYDNLQTAKRAGLEFDALQECEDSAAELVDIGIGIWKRCRPGAHDELLGMAVDDAICQISDVAKIAIGLEKVDETGIEEIMASLEGLDALYEEFQTIRSVVILDRELAILDDEIEDLDSKIVDAQTDIKAVDQEIFDLLKDGKTCPFSGEKLPKACVKSLSTLS
jgi:DNA repair exonuclease SbcCD ATPase subunit